MTEQGYKKIESFFKARPAAYSVLKFIYKYLPYPVFIGYPMLIAFEIWQVFVLKQNPPALYKTLCIPAITFLAVTLLRNIVNAPRPYEKYNISPLIKKDTVGHSFPSRHSTSVFIIAIAFFYVCVPLGVFLLFLGVIMCASRVLAGVHFIKDVTAGALFAILFGLMFSINSEIFLSIF